MSNELDDLIKELGDLVLVIETSPDADLDLLRLLVDVKNKYPGSGPYEILTKKLIPEHTLWLVENRGQHIDCPQQITKEKRHAS